jgi:hypothetical protein
MTSVLPALLPAQPTTTQTDDHEVSAHLHSFPPEALAQKGSKNELKPLHDLIPQSGTVVLVTTHDLIEDVNGVRGVVQRVGSSKQVYALRAMPAVQGEMFLNSLRWGTKVGQAHAVLTVNHELSVLLGAGAKRWEMHNGILIIRDGRIVWSRIASAQRPNAPHALDDFAHAFAHLLNE